jgi:hypothetical protein
VSRWCGTCQTRYRTIWNTGVQSKKNDWKEDTEPNFQETTKNVTEVGVSPSGRSLSNYINHFRAKIIIDQPEAERLLEQMCKKQIKKDSRVKLDKLFTEEEVCKVMERLPRGKQAGPNRIPNEMYKVMPTVFAN